MTVEQLTGLIEAVAWPLIVLVVLFTFRTEAKGLLNRLRKADWGKKVLEFGEATSDSQSNGKDKDRSDAQVEETISARLGDRPATLYWLGNDLMWIQDMLFRNAPLEAIRDAARNAISYATKLDLADTMVVAELNEVADWLDRYAQPPATPLLLSQRDEIASRVDKIKWFVSSRLRHEETDFEKLTVFPSDYT